MDLMEESRIVVILLLATYTEALINLYLSLKMGPEEFAKAEKMPLIKKWSSCPAQFNKDYSLSGDPGLEADLESLIQCRREVVHMTPEVTAGGETVHSGRRIVISPNNHELILKWAKVPLRLVNILTTFDRSGEAMMFKVTSGVFF